MPLKNASGAAADAQNYYQTFEESIVEQVRNILRDSREDGELLTIEAARNQAERFRQLGKKVADVMEDEVIKPLVQEREARKSLKRVGVDVEKLEKILKASRQ